jgi:membrane associated rhomboid family serine protease
MGLSSRDYYRESMPGPGIFTGSPVVKYLIIANVVVFLLQIFVVDNSRPSMQDIIKKRIANKDRQIDAEQYSEELNAFQLAYQKRYIVTYWLELDTEKVVEEGQVWRLITHAFCHSRYAIWHIVFNMLFLYWFGVTLESMYGSREFLLFYLTAAVFAALAFVGLDLYTGSRVPAIGASGAVMAVVMLYTIHFPYETICIYWFIQIQMRWLMALYLIYDLHPVLLSLSNDQTFTGIAHAAHLGGLAFGFLYGWYEWRLAWIVDGFSRLKWKRSKPRLRLYPTTPTPTPTPTPTRRASEPVPAAVPDPDTRRVDEVLDKISQYGQDSLTEEERSILRAASEKLKTRARGG